MNKLAAKMIIAFCDRLLLAHSANFIKLTFMVVKIFFGGESVLRPRICYTRGQLRPSVPLFTPLSVKLLRQIDVLLRQIDRKHCVIHHAVPKIKHSRNLN